MKMVLMLSGAISLVFGVLLLLVPAVIKKFSAICNQIVLDFDSLVKKFADFCNKVALNIDAKIEYTRKVSGVVFVVLSIAMLYIAVKR